MKLYVYLFLGLWIVGCVFSSPTIRQTENDVASLSSSPAEFHAGFTTDLDINCTLLHKNHLEFRALMSVILSKTKTSEDTVYTEIATVTLVDPLHVEVKDTVGGAEVKGQLMSDGDSYISYHWHFPPSDADGNYRCELFGMDPLGYPITSSETTTVTETSVLDKIRQMEATQDLLVNKLNTTTAELEQTKTELNKTKTELNKTKTDLNKAKTELIKKTKTCSPLVNILDKVEALSHYQGHTYVYTEKIVNGLRSEVTNFCNQIGGYLMEIDDQNEYDFLVQFLTGKTRDAYIHVGATDKGHEGTWTFEHSGKPVTFFKWKSGQPSDSGSSHYDYMVLSHKGTLEMYDVEDPRPSIVKNERALCEIPVHIQH